MKNNHVLFTLSIVAALALSASEAAAERINENSAKANQAFDACMDNGGGKIESGGMSSCIDHGGHGIICGGVKPEHQGTCDTFRRTPRNPWGLVAVEAVRLKVTRHPARQGSAEAK